MVTLLLSLECHPITGLFRVYDLVVSTDTLIASGLYGASQGIASAENRLLSFALTLEIELINAKAKNDPEEDKPQGKAVIGESTARVLSAAAYLGAETFSPVSFDDGPLPDFPLHSQAEFDTWLYANRAWIRSVMVRRYMIYDIGRDPARILSGKAISVFYTMELEETAIYTFKENFPWP